MSLGAAYSSVPPRGIFDQQTLLMTGFNPDVDSGSVPEDIWPIGGLIDFADVATVVSIVSDSANDTAAGTGAQSVLLNLIDDNFIESTQIVALNGLTPVVTSLNFLHVQTATVIAAGSAKTNEGIITFTIDGGVVNGIDVGKAQTGSCARIIPAARKPGTVAHLIRAFAVAGKQQSSLVTVTLLSTLAATGVMLEALDIPLVTEGGTFVFDISVPTTFTTGSRVACRVTEVSANNTLVSAGLQFVWLKSPDNF